MLDQLVERLPGKGSRGSLAVGGRHQAAARVDRQGATAPGASQSDVPRRRSLMAIGAPVAALPPSSATFGMWLVQLGRPASVETLAGPIVFTIDPPPGLSLAGPAASTSVPQLAISPDGRHVAFVAAERAGTVEPVGARPRRSAIAHAGRHRRRDRSVLVARQSPHRFSRTGRSQIDRDRPLRLASDDQPRHRSIHGAARGTAMGRFCSTPCVPGASDRVAATGGPVTDLALGDAHWHGSMARTSYQAANTCCFKCGMQTPI